MDGCTGWGVHVFIWLLKGQVVGFCHGKEQTWKKAKSGFCEATGNLDEMEKYWGINGDLLANAGVIKETAAQEAHGKIANKMEHSFGQLAQAAVAKAETIDAHATTI